MCENTRKHGPFSMSFHEFQRIFLTKISSSTKHERTKRTVGPNGMRLPPLPGEVWNPDMDGLKILFSPKDPKKNPQRPGFVILRTYRHPDFVILRFQFHPLQGRMILRVGSFWGAKGLCSRKKVKVIGLSYNMLLHTKSM